MANLVEISDPDFIRPKLNLEYDLKIERVITTDEGFRYIIEIHFKDVDGNPSEDIPVKYIDDFIPKNVNGQVQTLYNNIITLLTTRANNLFP